MSATSLEDQRSLSDLAVNPSTPRTSDAAHICQRSKHAYQVLRCGLFFLLQHHLRKTLDPYHESVGDQRGQTDRQGVIQNIPQTSQSGSITITDEDGMGARIRRTTTGRIYT